MSNLRQKTGKALVWDLVGNYGGQMIGFAISILLARLLEPEEFGVVGMSMVFLNILRVYMDFGFAAALINDQKSSSITYSSVFYFNVLLGLLLTIAVFFLAPFIGRFFESGIVTELVRWLSLGLFIGSFNIVQTTILRKKLDFKSLTFRDVIAQICAGVIAVTLAWKGYGVYALVIQFILAEIFKTILLWNITDWYPRREFSWDELKRLFSYSMYLVFSRSLGQVMKQLDALVVGKLFSAATLGFYTRALSVNTLINRNTSSLQRVFFPSLSKLKDKDERFRRIYLKVLRLAAGLAMLLVGVFYVSGRELIIGMFGGKWEPSVSIFKILILTGFSYPINVIVVTTFLAKGKAKEHFHVGNLRRVIKLSAFVVAYFWGFEAFLYAIVAVSILNTFVNAVFSSRILDIPLKKQLMAFVPYILLGAACIGLALTIFPSKYSYLYAGLKILLFLITYLSTLHFFKVPLTEEGWQALEVLRKKIAEYRQSS